MAERLRRHLTLALQVLSIIVVGLTSLGSGTTLILSSFLTYFVKTIGGPFGLFRLSAYPFLHIFARLTARLRAVGWPCREAYEGTKGRLPTLYAPTPSTIPRPRRAAAPRGTQSERIGIGMMSAEKTAAHRTTTALGSCHRTKMTIQDTLRTIADVRYRAGD